MLIKNNKNKKKPLTKDVLRSKHINMGHVGLALLLCDAMEYHARQNTVDEFLEALLATEELTKKSCKKKITKRVG